jgi:hypothetical protein
LDPARFGSSVPVVVNRSGLKVSLDLVIAKPED